MKKTNGVTLIALSITIIVLLIIAGISIYGGKSLFNKANLEELRTNMLLIESKAKESVEQANFKLGPGIENAADKARRISNAKTELKGIEMQTVNTTIVGTDDPGEDADYIFYYQLDSSHLSDMGLDKIELNEGENYIIKYNIKKATVEIYNTLGYNGAYSLQDIENINE